MKSRFQGARRGLGGGGRRGFVRRFSERGAVLVEASIVSLLLIAIAAGTLEYASLFESTTDTSGAVRSAARTGTITLANGDVTTDAQIIRALMSRSGDQRQNIDRLVIYKAGAGVTGPDPTCISGVPSIGALCNVYNKSDLSKTEDQIAAMPAAQRRWPEKDRVPTDDYLGIWVKVDRPRLVSLIPSPSSYVDNFTMRIGPKPTASAATSWSPAELGTPLPRYVEGKPEQWPQSWSCDVYDASKCAIHGGSGGGNSGGGGGGGS